MKNVYIQHTHFLDYEKKKKHKKCRPKNTKIQLQSLEERSIAHTKVFKCFDLTYYKNITKYKLFFINIYIIYSYIILLLDFTFSKNHNLTEEEGLSFKHLTGFYYPRI